MKNLLFGLLAIVMFSSSAVAQTAAKSGPGFWATAAIDAGGALGGAASVAQLTGPPVTPLHWWAVGGGALIGGAAASVAVHANKAVSPGNNGVGDINNPKNQIDWVGTQHNNIAKDYIATYGEYNSETFYNFVSENREKYQIKEMQLSVEYLSRQATQVNSLKSQEEIFIFILDQLPKEVNKNEFRSFLTTLFTKTASQSTLDYIRKYEDQIYSKQLPPISLAQMSAFFTTLRNSTNLWEVSNKK